MQTWKRTARAAAMRAAGVNPERAPEAAMEEFLESRKPPPEKRRRTRKGRIRSDDYHAWMLERDEC